MTIDSPSEGEISPRRENARPLSERGEKEWASTGALQEASYTVYLGGYL